MKKLIMALVLMPMMALAATFTGELYGAYYGDKEDCGIWHVEESWKNGPDWRDDYVDVDGVKEPATWSEEEYAFEVSVAPGENFTAQVVHLTSTDAHIQSCRGAFKGSFKVYELEGSGTATKLKKYTFNVNGVVVDGVGYGTATCKKPAVNWAVTVR